MPGYKSKSEWAEELEQINVVRKVTPWRMARLILYGIESFCRSKDEIASLYDEMSEQLEINRKTLQNYASVARRFPEEMVHHALEIGHHITVVAMDGEMAHLWLRRAEENAWSVQRLRAEIRQAAETPSEEDDDPIDNRDIAIRTLTRYGINPQADDKWVSLGFPDGKFVNIDSNTTLKWSVT